MTSSSTLKRQKSFELCKNLSFSFNSIDFIENDHKDEEDDIDFEIESSTVAPFGDFDQGIDLFDNNCNNNFNINNNNNLNNNFDDNTNDKLNNDEREEKDQLKWNLNMVAIPNREDLKEKIEYNYNGKIPTLKEARGNCDIQFIDGVILSKLIEGKFNHQFKKYFIIDCRYEYEFINGHIKNAINLPLYSLHNFLQEFFLNFSLIGLEVAVILHCEFSVKRAPKNFKVIRGEDRKRNLIRYPQLTFPNLYILKGGYSKFYRDFPEFCFPQCYVKMKDKKYARELSVAIKKENSICNDFELNNLTRLRSI